MISRADDNNTAVGAEREPNRNDYPKPRELVIQLGMKDIFFDFFIGKKAEIWVMKI